MIMREDTHNGLYCCGYFLDIEKGFDIIDHGILLRKLKYYGINGHELGRFINNSYDCNLCDRVDNIIRCYDISYWSTTWFYLGPCFYIICECIFQYIEKFNIFLDNTMIYFFGRNMSEIKSNQQCALNLCYGTLQIGSVSQVRNSNVAINSLMARFMGSTWGPSGSDRTQVGPILAPWALLSGFININDDHLNLLFWQKYARNRI